MDFSSSTMPTNTALLIVLWGIISFVIWYFFRHSSRENRAGFRSIFLLISALFFFVFALTWFQNRPQSELTRIAIFPFISQSKGAELISWESQAFSEVPTKFLQQKARDELLPYQLDWIIEAADLDSLASPKYCLDFAKRVHLNFAVLGEFKKVGSDYELKYRIHDVIRNKFVLEENVEIDLSEIRSFGRGLSLSILNGIHIPQNDGSVKNQWHSTAQIRHYFEFKHSLIKGSSNAAFSSLQNAVAADSGSLVCLNSLAGQHIKRGLDRKEKLQTSQEDFRTAQSLLLKSLSKDRLNSETLRLLAELYLANERWGRGEEYLRKSLEINPWDSQLYLDLTYLHPSRYAALGFTNENELLQRVVFINPCDFRARLLLANNYSMKNRYDLAIGTVDEILTINHNEVRALMTLANFYLAQNQMLNSLQTYERILDLEPDNADAYYNLGIIHYHQKDYEQAIEYFEHAIKLIDHVDSYLYLAYIYEQNNDVERALGYLRARIAKRQGAEDKFADEARKHLAKILAERETNGSAVTKTQDQENQ